MFRRKRFRFPEFRGQAPDAMSAARALFHGAGPLARCKGAAAIIDYDGSMVAANGAALDLAPALGLAEAAPLRPEIAAAISAGRPLVVPLAGESGALTVEVLPLGQGAALLLGHEAGAAGALNQALADSRARYKALVEM